MAAKFASEWDHWIAFFLLAGLGVRMIWVGLKPGESPVDQRPQRHSFWILALTGLATRIDAMAVCVGLAFVDVAIGWIAAAIGAASFVMVTAGVLLGRALGAVAGRRAEVLGGLLLVGIGTEILVEHFGGLRQSVLTVGRPLVRLVAKAAFRRCRAAPITWLSLNGHRHGARFSPHSPDPCAGRPGRRQRRLHRRG